MIIPSTYQDPPPIVRLFDPARLKTLLLEDLKISTHQEIANRGGVCHNTVRRWEQVQKSEYQGALQDNLFQIFGPRLFTHGLDYTIFPETLTEYGKQYKSQRIAAENFGIGRTTYNTWRLGLSRPYMGYHRHIYNRFGIIVFKLMEKENDNSPK